jgi:CRP/FNR family transcriptional regulator, cyclic AMP receptor protein
MTARSSKTRKSFKNRPAEDLERCQEETGPLDEETRRTKIKHLSAMELFRDLTPGEIEEIERATVMWSCKAGRVFYTPGETGEVLFILKKGAVQIYRKSARGRKLVIDHLRPYAFFGEMTWIGQGMYHRFAITTEDSLVCTMKRADVERLLLSKPQVALRLIQAIGERSLQVEERLEEFAFKEAKSRVAAFLLRVAGLNEIKGLRHQDIADTLGIFRETVTDALAELKASGIIRIERRRITILDSKRLEDRAG